MAFLVLMFIIAMAVLGAVGIVVPTALLDVARPHSGGLYIAAGFVSSSGSR